MESVEFTRRSLRCLTFVFDDDNGTESRCAATVSLSPAAVSVLVDDEPVPVEADHPAVLAFICRLTDAATAVRPSRRAADRDKRPAPHSTRPA